MASSQVKFFILFAIIAGVIALNVVSAQDYDDENSQNQGNDGFGGYSGSEGDDDYAAPRDQNSMAGAEGSEQSPGYQQGADSSNDGYDDSAAAASNVKPSLVKLIRASRK